MVNGSGSTTIGALNGNECVWYGKQEQEEETEEEEAEEKKKKNCLIIEIRYLLCTLTFRTIEWESEWSSARRRRRASTHFSIVRQPPNRNCDIDIKLCRLTQ